MPCPVTEKMERLRWVEIETPAVTITIPVTITDGKNTYTVTSIGNLAFSSCSGLTSVYIPDGVASIGDFASSKVP